VTENIFCAKMEYLHSVGISGKDKRNDGGYKEKGVIKTNGDMKGTAKNKGSFAAISSWFTGKK